MATALYRLTEQAVGGDLRSTLAEWRAEGLSIEDIAFRLRTDHDLTVSIPTLYRWLAAPTGSAS